jgi:hypothetical protein
MSLAGKEHRHRHIKKGTGNALTLVRGPPKLLLGAKESMQKGCDDASGSHNVTLIGVARLREGIDYCSASLRTFQTLALADHENFSEPDRRFSRIKRIAKATPAREKMLRTSGQRRL